MGPRPASRGRQLIDLAHRSGMPAGEGRVRATGPPSLMCPQESLETPLGNSESGRDGDLFQKYREESAREKNRVLSAACTVFYVIFML